MALSGTLADIGIVELIQFPSNGRKTGELIIAGFDDEARLYYEEGALVHATAGDRSGMESLVEVVSWTTGEFEFRMGVETDNQTIEIDLHRALMLALKTRDERAEEERKKSDAPSGEFQSEVAEKVAPVLRRLVSSNDALSGAYLLSETGELLAQYETNEFTEAEVMKETMLQLGALYESYPRNNLTRIFLDDDDGILHSARVGKGHILVVAARKEISMGVVSMMMNKLLSGILEV